MLALAATGNLSAIASSTGSSPIMEFSSPAVEPAWLTDNRSERRNLAVLEITCDVDEDCPMMHNCGLVDPGVCAHKKLFPPTVLEVFGWVVFAVTKAVSNVAGIGGGGVSVPVLMGMFAFDTKPAVAISSFSIFVSSISAFVINFKKMHPEKPHAVLIDYGIVTIMMPLVLAGS